MAILAELFSGVTSSTGPDAMKLDIKYKISDVWTHFLKLDIIAAPVIVYSAYIRITKA